MKINIVLYMKFGIKDIIYDQSKDNILLAND